MFREPSESPEGAAGPEDPSVPAGDSAASFPAADSRFAPSHQPRAAGRAAALLTTLVYMTLSVASVNDFRMFRVTAYAIAGLALVWFSEELGVKFDIPRWTGAVMGTFLFVFPVIVFLAVVVANSLS